MFVCPIKKHIKRYKNKTRNIFISHLTDEQKLTLKENFRDPEDTEAVS